MSNFLEDLTIPQLGEATFQTDFNAFCSAIKNNFERLVSVQFTKGNDGNSVVTKHITIDKDLNENDTMSNLSFQIVKSIYNLEGDSPITIGAFKQLLQGTSNQFGDPDNGGIAPSFYDAFSFPQLQSIPTEGIEVDIVIDEHNGKSYMAVPYIFIDGRISELSRYKREHADDDIYKTFHDYSTAVFGEGTYIETDEETKIVDWEWETISMDIVPKLYFDDTIGEFCWEVNGQRTGVTAQGVKGNDGIASHIYMAKGHRHTNDIEILSIQINTDTGVEWTDFGVISSKPDIINYINGEKSIIKSVAFLKDGQEYILRDNDFLLVFYDWDEPNVEPTQVTEAEYKWGFFGKPHIDGVNVKVYCEQDHSDDIFTAILKQNFRDYLNGIYGNTLYSDVRGLYIPGRSQNGEDPTQYHMTYSESPTKMHSAIVNEQDTHGIIDGPVTQEIGDWQIDYNTQVQGTLGVQGNVTMRNDSCVQGNLNVQGNIEASSISVTGEPFRSIQGLRPAVVSTFKDANYKVERLVKLHNPTLTQSTNQVTDIGYKIQFYSTLNLKVGLMSNSIYNSTNINRQMHEMVGRYGAIDAAHSNYGNMWNEGDVESEINNDAEVITTQGYFHNAPKLYDVIEYDIPIIFERDIQIIGNVDSSQSYIITPQGSTSITLPYSQTRIGVQNVMGSNLSFNDISYRVILQGLPGLLHNSLHYEYGDNIGDSLDLPDVDVFAMGDDYSLDKILIPGAFRSLVEYSQQIPYESYTFKGTLDYKGIQLKYYIDVFCRIQEIIGRNTLDQQGLRVPYPSGSSNISLILSPIGYVEYDDGYKSPIYGNEIVTNKSQDNIDGNSSNKRRKILK